MRFVILPLNALINLTDAAGQWQKEKEHQADTLSKLASLLSPFPSEHIQWTRTTPPHQTKKNTEILIHHINKAQALDHIPNINLLLLGGKKNTT